MSLPRLVFLTSLFPFPPRSGAALRDAGLIGLLREETRFELVTVLSPSAAAPEERGEGLHFVRRERARFWRRALNPLRPYVGNGYSRAVEAKLRELFEPGACLWISRLALGRYAEYGRSVGYRVVLDEHNVESDYYWQAALRAGKWLELPRAWQLRGWERRLCRAAHAVTTTSARDAELLRKLCGEDLKIETIPNCVYAPPTLAPAATTRSLLFVGTLDYQPNVEGIEWFLREAWPELRGEATLTIVGARPSESLRRRLEDSGATLRANVPSLEPFYREAAVCVAPLFSGGGTRLKILESLAHGRPTIATNKAAEGLGLEPGTHYVRAETGREFIAAVRALFDDPGEARRVAEAGARMVRERYSWRAQEKSVKRALAID